MKFKAEPCIGRHLMRFTLPAILAFALFGCVGNRRSDSSEENSTPKTKQGDIIAGENIPSPDGRYVCTVFGETFYNTTGYRRHIYLRHAGEPRGFPGNVHIVEAGDDVEVAWTSPTNLSVKLSYESPQFRRDLPTLPTTTNLVGVTITFSQLTR